MKKPLANDCFALPPGVSWTPVDDALAQLERRLHCVVGIETVDVFAAQGRVLATDAARLTRPPIEWPTSTMRSSASASATA
ncbi:MAG: hypothetical protein AAF386_04745, partial [Pseudomonadota bacterium]